MLHGSFGQRQHVNLLSSFVFCACWWSVNGQSMPTYLPAVAMQPATNPQNLG